LTKEKDPYKPSDIHQGTEKEQPKCKGSRSKGIIKLGTKTNQRTEK
jgi:hypothetical protein